MITLTLSRYDFLNIIDDIVDVKGFTEYVIVRKLIAQDKLKMGTYNKVIQHDERILNADIIILTIYFGEACEDNAINICREDRVTYITLQTNKFKVGNSVVSIKRRYNNSDNEDDFLVEVLKHE